MKVCPKCGQVTNDDSDEFCTKCGAYFTKDQAPQGQTTAIGAALGSVQSARPQSVPIPQGGTFAAGFDHMSRGNFPEAVAQWTSAVREGGQPSDDDYRAMISAAADCISSDAGDGEAHARGGVAELAMELEGDFLQDIMAELVSRASGLERRKQLADVTSDYMFMAMETFSVYPDLRDVVAVIAQVPSDMEAFGSLAESLEDDDEGRAGSLVSTYTSFSDMICGSMRENIEKAGEERMDALAEYWSTKAVLPYANVAYQLANLYTQISSAKNVGRFASRLFKKGLDIQRDAFIKSYFDVRLRSEEV